MRITNVTAELFRWDGIPPSRYGANMDTGGVSDLALVTIETDAGISGHAFLGASFRPARLDVRGMLTCGRDVVIDVNCVFEGLVELGAGVQVGANCVLRNVKIAAATRIDAFTLIDDAVIGEANRLGPFIVRSLG